MAYFLLKHCLGIPKLTYLIWTMPMWKYSEWVDSTDTLIKDTLEKICNIEITEYQHNVISLPCRFGGLGIRKISDVMYPAFMSSVISSYVLVNSMLGSNALDLTEISHYDEALLNWNIMNTSTPSSCVKIQAKWDKINITLNE